LHVATGSGEEGKTGIQVIRGRLEDEGWGKEPSWRWMMRDCSKKKNHPHKRKRTTKTQTTHKKNAMAKWFSAARERGKLAFLGILNVYIRTNERGGGQGVKTSAKTWHSSAIRKLKRKGKTRKNILFTRKNEEENATTKKKGKPLNETSFGCSAAMVA